MRWNLRITKCGHTFFMMLSETQTLEGVTSLLDNGKHVVLWDLEGCLQEQAEESLRYPQHKYNLSNIYLFSDLARSFRAWCFTQVEFKTYLKILLDTEYVDWNFFYYTAKRKKATLRVSNKKNRPRQRLVSVLESYTMPMPEIWQKVVYDTGIEKRGRSILLGDVDG